jgi:uncharacterized protein (TIGR03435 family)
MHWLTMAVRFIAGSVLLLACAVVGFAQSLPVPPDAKAPRFEVTSVKRNVTDPKDGIQGPRRVEPERFISIGWPLRYVIAMAYGARSFQIVGAPEWIETVFFDINAKAPANTPNSQILPMVRALLADRFKMRAHVERREMPVYTVVVAQAGRLGPGMKTTTANCAQLRADGKATRGQPGEFPVCASRLTASAANGTMTLEMGEGGMSVPSFIASLSGYVDRLVIDRTGLTGDFDFLLQFAPPGAPAAALPDPGQAPLDSAPTLFDAVQRQLGLRLQPERALVDVLVIDQIDQPTPD